MEKFYVCGGSDGFWTETKARTLRGAKVVCSKTYQESVGGKMEVGKKFGSGDESLIERVAVKYGYEKWQG